MLNLNTPTVDQLQAFHQNRQAINSACEISRSLARLVDKMKPATLAAIAQRLNPEIPISQALSELQITIDNLAAEADEFNRLATEAEQDFHERIKPVYDRAVIRYFEVSNFIPARKKSIASMAAEHPRKLQKLIDAGLSYQEAATSVGQLDVSVQQTELEAAVVEHAALERFTRSYDIDDLPDTFALPEGFKRSVAG